MHIDIGYTVVVYTKAVFQQWQKNKNNTYGQNVLKFRNGAIKFCTVENCGEQGDLKHFFVSHSCVGCIVPFKKP